MSDLPEPTPRYRRVVLDLPPRQADRQVLQAAAELARLLDAELHAVFVEDPALAALAEIPFARELRLPTHDWQPLHHETLANEMRLAFDKARQDIAALRVAMGVRGETQMLRGDPGSLLASLCVDSDIVVLAPPSQPSEHVLRQHAHRHRATRRSAASVMALPPRRTLESGPVAVVLRDVGDDALTVAARIAARAGQELLILAPSSVLDAALARARTLQGAGTRVRGKLLSHPTPDSIAAILRRQAVRLCVLTRPELAPDEDATLQTLARESQVPILALEPPAA